MKKKLLLSRLKLQKIMKKKLMKMQFLNLEVKIQSHLRKKIHLKF